VLVVELLDRDVPLQQLVPARHTLAVAPPSPEDPRWSVWMSVYPNGDLMAVYSIKPRLMERSAWPNVRPQWTYSRAIDVRTGSCLQ
jgi:hypothetical protein